MELRNIADKDVSFANIILSLFLNGILLITRVLVQNSAMCLISLSWQMMTLSFYSRTRIQSVPQHKKASDFNSAEQLYHEQCHTFVLFLSYIWKNYRKKVTRQLVTIWSSWQTNQKTRASNQNKWTTQLIEQVKLIGVTRWKLVNYQVLQQCDGSKWDLTFEEAELKFMEILRRPNQMNRNILLFQAKMETKSAYKYTKWQLVSFQKDL